MKILMTVVLVEAKLPLSIRDFKSVPDGNIFNVFINFFTSDMNCNFISKKLITWFNENKEANKERDFGFRFRGKESRNFLTHFPKMVKLLQPLITPHFLKKLFIVFYQTSCLRKFVSTHTMLQTLLLMKYVLLVANYF